MDYCTGSDLSVYIKNRGQTPSLDFVPRNSADGKKIFWPHPPVGGLSERVTRNFLGQLGESPHPTYHGPADFQLAHCNSFAKGTSYIEISSHR